MIPVAIKIAPKIPPVQEIEELVENVILESRGAADERPATSIMIAPTK